MSFAELQKLQKLKRLSSKTHADSESFSSCKDGEHVAHIGMDEGAILFSSRRDGEHAEGESKLLVPRLLFEDALQEQPRQDQQHMSQHLLILEASENEEEQPKLHIRSVGDIVKASRDRRKQEEALLIAKHSRSVAKIGVCILENKPNSKSSSATSSSSSSKGGGKTSKQATTTRSEFSAESFSPLNQEFGVEKEDLSLSLPIVHLVDELSYSLFATDENWKNDTLSKCRKVILSREALLLRTQTAFEENGVRDNALVLKSIALNLALFTEEGTFFPPIHLLSGGSSELLLRPK